MTLKTIEYSRLSTDPFLHGARADTGASVEQQRRDDREHDIDHRPGQRDQHHVAPRMVEPAKLPAPAWRSRTGTCRASRAAGSAAAGSCRRDRYGCSGLSVTRPMRAARCRRRAMRRRSRAPPRASVIAKIDRQRHDRDLLQELRVFGSDDHRTPPKSAASSRSAASRSNAPAALAARLGRRDAAARGVARAARSRRRSRSISSRSPLQWSTRSQPACERAPAARRRARRRAPSSTDRRKEARRQSRSSRE